MSKIIECDEGFITSIGKSDLSITDIKVKIFIKLSYLLIELNYC
jgi:hypothetical protein